MSTQFDALSIQREQFHLFNSTNFRGIIISKNNERDIYTDCRNLGFAIARIDLQDANTQAVIVLRSIADSSNISNLCKIAEQHNCDIFAILNNESVSYYVDDRVITKGITTIQDIIDYIAGNGVYTVVGINKVQPGSIGMASRMAEYVKLTGENPNSGTI